MTNTTTQKDKNNDSIPHKNYDNFDDETQRLVLVDLVSKLMGLLVLFLTNLFKRLKIE